MSDELNRQLLQAASQGELETVRQLLTRGANPNTQDHLGDTALIFACRNPVSVEIVQVLLELPDINVHILNNEGCSALMEACIDDDNDVIVTALLEHGSEPNITESESNLTALMYASMKGHSKIVPILLQYGADATRKDNDGKTALMLSVIPIDEDDDDDDDDDDDESDEDSTSTMVKSLLEFNANPDIQDNDGKTALTHAIERCNYDSTIPIYKVYMERDSRYFQDQMTDHNRLYPFTIHTLCLMKALCEARRNIESNYGVYKKKRLHDLLSSVITQLRRAVAQQEPQEPQQPQEPLVTMEDISRSISSLITEQRNTVDRSSWNCSDGTSIFAIKGIQDHVSGFVGPSRLLDEQQQVERSSKRRRMNP